MVIALSDDFGSSIRVDQVFSISKRTENAEVFSGLLVLVLVSGAEVTYAYSSKRLLDEDVSKVALLMVADKAYPTYPTYPVYPSTPWYPTVPAPNTGEPLGPDPVIYCDTVNVGNGQIR